jgi:hypothetical protein
MLPLSRAMGRYSSLPFKMMPDSSEGSQKLKRMSLLWAVLLGLRVQERFRPSSETVELTCSLHGIQAF